MPLDCNYVKGMLVIPVLRALNMDSDAAVNIMMGTAAIESDMGAFRTQIGGGPARGLFGCERATEEDIWRYVNRPDKTALKSIFVSLVSRETIPPYQFLEMAVSDIYACALARIKYWMIPHALPPADMIAALGSYYCQFYNAGGASTTLKFVQKYQEYVTCGN